MESYVAAPETFELNHENAGIVKDALAVYFRSEEFPDSSDGSYEEKALALEYDLGSWFKTHKPVVAPE